MVVKLIFPIIVGFSIVLQGTLNRQIAANIGLMSAVLLNALVFLVLATAMWIAMRFQIIPYADFLSVRPIEHLKWIDFIPGCCGLLIVCCTPIAIRALGASITFSTIVFTQIIISLIWDILNTQKVPDFKTVLGAIFVFCGVFFLYLGKE